jgi:hypothetical protein
LPLRPPAYIEIANLLFQSLGQLAHQRSSPTLPIVPATPLEAAYSLAAFRGIAVGLISGREFAPQVGDLNPIPISQQGARHFLRLPAGIQPMRLPTHSFCSMAHWLDSSSFSKGNEAHTS